MRGASRLYLDKQLMRLVWVCVRASARAFAICVVAFSIVRTGFTNNSVPLIDCFVCNFWTFMHVPEWISFAFCYFFDYFHLCSISMVLFEILCNVYVCASLELACLCVDVTIASIYRSGKKTRSGVRCDHNFWNFHIVNCFLWIFCESQTVTNVIVVVVGIVVCVCVSLSYGAVRLQSTCPFTKCGAGTLLRYMFDGLCRCVPLLLCYSSSSSSSSYMYTRWCVFHLGQMILIGFTVPNAQKMTLF